MAGVSFVLCIFSMLECVYVTHVWSNDGKFISIFHVTHHLSTLNTFALDSVCLFTAPVTNSYLAGLVSWNVNKDNHVSLCRAESVVCAEVFNVRIGVTVFVPLSRLVVL